MPLRPIRPAIAVALLIVLGGCTAASLQPTPYQALEAGTGGYSETQLDPTTWRVDFVGNRATPRDRVRNAALYRAAELALAQGYDRFAVLETETRPEIRLYPVRDPFWPSYRRHYRHSLFDPWHFGGWPYRDRYGYVASESRYDGSVLVRLLRPGEPAGPAVVHDARTILASLGPRVDPKP